MSVSIKLWRDDIMSRLRGAGPEIVDAEIRRACALWCEKTRKYHQLLPAIDLVANQAKYTPVAPQLDTPEDQEVVGIWSVRLSTEVDPLPQATEDQLDDIARGWRNGTFTNGTPLFWRAEDSTIELIPAPAAAVTGGLIVDAVLAPSHDAATVADQLYKRMRYRQIIEAGVLAKMFAMHTKPWANPLEAVRMEKDWEAGLGQADVDNYRGFARAPLRTRPIYR